MSQPDPEPGQGVVLFRLLKRLTERAEAGIETYGTLLEAHNGRSALEDALDEVLDAAMYLMQKIMEDEDEAN